MQPAKPLNIGGISVQRIVDTVTPFRSPEEMYPDATAAAVEAERHWMEPAALCPQTGRLRLTVQSYLVRTRRHTLLIDTCIGCDKTVEWFPPWHQRTDRSWLDRLAAAGVGPADIDYVFCTHLHGDHCGWNTQLVDGRWLPTFANAKYVIARDEVARFEGGADASYLESVLPIIESGQALLVDTDHALDDEVWLEPAIGHTPGHVMVGLASNGRQAVMFGDLMHSPIQCRYPDWRCVSDADPERAKRTRRDFLDAHCERDRLVMTAHFPSPSVGHIVRHGDTFDFRTGADGL